MILFLKEGDRLNKGEWISGNEWLSSSNDKFILRIRNSQVVELCFLSEKLVLWNLTTTAALSLDRLVMQENGNLVLYGTDNIPYWWSNTLSSSGYFVLEENGNMVVYKQSVGDDDDDDDDVVWQSFTSQSKNYICST